MQRKHKADVGKHFKFNSSSLHQQLRPVNSKERPFLVLVAPVLKWIEIAIASTQLRRLPQVGPTAATRTTQPKQTKPWRNLEPELRGSFFYDRG